MGLLRYAKAARNDRKEHTPAPLFLEGNFKVGVLRSLKKTCVTFVSERWKDGDEG